MGVLVFDDALKANIARVRAHAEQSKHWYDVRQEKRPKPPGDDPNFRFRSGTHGVVFSWTQIKDSVVIRHLTMSTARGYPQPVSVFTMADLLGFTGAVKDENDLVWKPAESWRIGSNKDEHCVTIQEEVKG